MTGVDPAATDRTTADRWRVAVACVAWCVLCLWLPVVVLAYSPAWYRYNASVTERTRDELGLELAYVAIDDLVRFYRHQGELAGYWSTKEAQHHAEVRRLYDGFTVLAAVAAVIAALCWRRRDTARIAGATFIVFASLVLVLPFFGLFWRQLFHVVLFDNDAWLNVDSDISYYLFRHAFFKRSIVIISAFAVSLNLALWLIARRWHHAGHAQTTQLLPAVASDPPDGTTAASRSDPE